MQIEELRKYLTKAFLTGSIKTIFVILSTILFLPLIIKNIGMSNYGIIALATIFSGNIAFLDLGISKSITLMLGKSKSKEEANKIFSIGIFSTSIIFTIFIFLISILVFSDVPIFGSEINIKKNLFNNVIFASLLFLYISLFNNALIAVLDAKYLNHQVNNGYLLTSLLTNIFLYLGSLLKLNIEYLIFLPALANFFASLFFVFFIIKHTSIRFTKFKFKEIRDLLKLSIRFLNIDLISSMVLPINKLLIVIISGQTLFLGIFEVAVKIGRISNSLLVTIAKPLFGVFAGEKNYSKIISISHSISKIIFLGYIIGVCCFYVFGESIVSFIDKINFKDLYQISFILIIAMGMSAVTEPFFRAILAMEKLRLAFLTKAIVPVLNIILFILFSELNTLLRVSLSLGLSVFISNIILLLLQRKFISKNLMGEN